MEILAAKYNRHEMWNERDSMIQFHQFLKCVHLKVFIHCRTNILHKFILGINEFVYNLCVTISELY